MEQPTSNTEHRRTMKRVLLILLGVALVIGLAVALLMASGARPVRTATTIGGIEVELLQALPSGKQFTTEKPWHSWAKRILPFRYQKWIPNSSSGSCSSDTNSITVYLLVGTTNGAAVNQLPWESYRAESLDGEIFASEGGSCSFGGGMAGAPKINGLFLRAFPRRDPAFILRFTKYDGTVLGALRVPNPVKRSFSDWTPLPVPQAATNGDVVLNLREISLKSYEVWRFLSPEFALVSDNPLWSGTKVTYTTYRDATGNEGFPLSRKEPAWRVVATVYRTETKRMQDGEKLILTNLVAPAAGTFTLQSEEAILAGVRMRTTVLAGPGMLYRTNTSNWGAAPFTQNEGVSYSTSGSSSDGKTQINHWGYGRPFLLIETDSATLPDGTQLFCHAYDTEGRPLGPERTGGYDTDKNGWQTRVISFENWTNGALSRLEILVSRPRIFEFLIDPSAVKTNAVKR